jgi:hypothetical protein
MTNDQISMTKLKFLLVIGTWSLKFFFFVLFVSFVVNHDR